MSIMRNYPRNYLWGPQRNIARELERAVERLMEPLAEDNESDVVTSQWTPRVERAHGTFYRRFALPDTADAGGISARGEHGVLRIEIPKRQASKPRRIEVR